jgi:hypothetical protein
MMIVLSLFLLAGLLLWCLPGLPPKASEFGYMVALATLIALIPLLAGAVR